MANPATMLGIPTPVNNTTDTSTPAVAPGATAPQSANPMDSLDSSWQQAQSALQKQYPNITGDQMNSIEQKFRSDYVNNFNNQRNQGNTGLSGWVVNNIAEPLWQNTIGPAAATVASAGRAIGTMLGGNVPTTQDLDKPVDFGPLGYTNPIQVPENIRQMQGNYGDVLGLASVIPGEALVSGAKATLVGAGLKAVGPLENISDAGVADISKNPGFLSKLKTWMGTALKGGLSFAIPQGMSQAYKSESQGATPGKAAVEGATNFAGNELGMLLFKGGADALSWGASKLIGSQLGKIAGGFAVDTINKILNIDPELNGRPGQFNLDALNSWYQVAKRNVSFAVKNILQEKDVDPNDMLNSVRGMQRNIVTNMYAAKDAKYGSFINDQTQLPEAPKTADAWNDAYDLAKEKYGLQDDGSIKSKIDALSVRGIGRTGQQSSSFLQNLVTAAGSIFDKDGDLAPITTRTLDQMYMSRDGNLAPDENKAWQKIKTSGYGDMRSYFENSDDPITKGHADDMDGAQNAANQIRDVAGKGIVPQVKAAYDSQQVLHSMMDTAPDAKLRFQQVWDNMLPAQKQTFGKMAFNLALDWAERMNGNQALGGKWLSDFAGKWANEGVFTPEQLFKMQTYSDSLTGTFDNLRRNVFQVLGKTPGETGPAQAEEVLGNKPLAEGEKGTLLQQAQQAKTNLDIGTALKGQPAYTVKGGKYDFTNIIKAVHEVNSQMSSNGQYDELERWFNNIQGVAQHGKATFKGLVEMAIGTSMFGGHPMIGAGIIYRGLGNFLGKGIQDFGADDIPTIADKLIKSGAMTPTNLTKLLTGDWGPVMTALGQTAKIGTQQKVGQGTQELLTGSD